MLISIETHITCDFPGGGGPLSPLWIRTWMQEFYSLTDYSGFKLMKLCSCSTHLGMKFAICISIKYKQLRQFIYSGQETMSTVQES